MVTESYDTLEIPTPLQFCVGIIVGSTLNNPLVFFRIVTELSDKLYCKSTSSIICLVLPSRTTNFGGVTYPTPAEETPTFLIFDSGSIFKISAILAEGLTVESAE